MSSIYYGERYVPQHEGEWDTAKTYDRLSIVTVTTGDNVDAYISRVPVPAGTPITDNNFWALLYISRITSGGATSVSWVDIENKPDTFPPSAHTQGWDTITGKPSTFNPAPHTQGITTINGLAASLGDLQSQIDNISVGGGSEISTIVVALKETVNIASSLPVVVPFNSIIRAAQSGSATWTVDASGLFSLHSLNGGTYDIYMSGSMYMTTFGSTTVARMLTVQGGSNVLAHLYVAKDIPNITLPDTLVGTLTDASNTNFRAVANFQAGDSFGLTSSTITRDFLTLKAIRRG